jgi:hypothetical protein
MGQRIAELQHRCSEGALMSTLRRDYDLAKASMYRYLSDSDSSQPTQHDQNASSLEYTWPLPLRMSVESSDQALDSTGSHGRNTDADGPLVAIGLRAAHPLDGRCGTCPSLEAVP